MANIKTYFCVNASMSLVGLWTVWITEYPKGIQTSNSNTKVENDLTSIFSSDSKEHTKATPRIQPFRNCLPVCAHRVYNHSETAHLYVHIFLTLTCSLWINMETSSFSRHCNRMQKISLWVTSAECNLCTQCVQYETVYELTLSPSIFGYII